VQLRDAWPDIEARGVRLVVVGNGQPFHAQDFHEQHRLPFTLLTDPDLKAFAAAGLRRDVLSTVNPRVLGNAFRALRGGHRQGKVQGDPWQQGGVFVITPENETRFSYVSRAAGDHPPPEKILAAL
jgi:hypothetical protein